MPLRPERQPRIVYAACGGSLVLGLFFVFVQAPHPWGWEGFDHYHQLALDLARGKPFSTMEVPWGYAYFLAAFYRTFGDRPWIPLLVQVGVNACMPMLVFAAARAWFDRLIATVAAVLTGLCSFNTVYASTQSSDAVCTVLFMTSVIAFVIARRRDQATWFALVGALTGVVAQFRPNLILVPAVFAGYAIFERRTLRRVRHAIVLLIASAAALSPWIVRNYRLTGTLMPTSVHGGVQLWYGTLQVGPYLHSRAYNPRSVFDTPVFEYTSLLDASLLVQADVNPCLPARPTQTSFVYWTDHDHTRRRVEQPTTDREFAAEIPPAHQPAVFYYYFESICPGETSITHSEPQFGGQAPFLYFIREDQLGDLDVHGELLDLFDLVRMVRHTRWGEPLPFAEALTAAGVADLPHAVEALTPIPATGLMTAPPPSLAGDRERATLLLPDGSSITVPRLWTGRVTDLSIDGALALALMHSTASLAELERARAAGSAIAGHARTGREDIAINRVFYRLEPQMMRRYFALALDNIRRDPSGFVAASAYRAVRLFVIAGTDDRHTAQQFARSRAVYAAGTITSLLYLVLFAGGAIVAWRKGHDVLLPLLLILYIPATLAPVLTNMRYAVTVQPLIFMFIGVATTALASLPRAATATAGGSGRAGTRTARQL